MNFLINSPDPAEMNFEGYAKVRVKSLIPDNLGYYRKVQERQEREDLADQRHKDQNSPKEQDSKDARTVSDKEVADAIEAFQADKQAKQAGLSVAAAGGSGPGLKVVLKDAGGQVLRQMSGEEFLKLRDAISRIGKSSGKILDEKL